LQHFTSSSLTRIFLPGPAIIFSRENWTQDSYQAISAFLSHSEVTRMSSKHNVQIRIADSRYIDSGVVGNVHDVLRRHTHYDTEYRMTC
jgi:hypothetical protein